MTKQDQIKALAELDKWTDLRIVDDKNWIGNPFIGCNPTTKLLSQVPDYLHSYDAIIPLIKKVMQTDDQRHIFLETLSQIVHAVDYEISAPNAWMMFSATPSQLCEALLRATGKWKE